MSLRLRILSVSLATILVFVAVSFVMSGSLNAVAESRGWVEHTYRVIGQGERLLALMIDQETGMRGFLATGREEFLEPYDAGKIEFATLMAELQTTVSDNPPQVERLQGIDQQAQEWDAQAASLYIGIRREINQFDVINDRILGRLTSGAGKALMDSTREGLDVFGGSLAARRVLEDMINMETGLRGFLAARDEVFLEPYDAGRGTIAANLAALGSATVSTRANAWITEYAEVQIADAREAATYQTRDDLNDVMADNRGKVFMDAIRAEIATFVGIEADLLEIRTSEADAQQSRARITLILALVLAVGIGGTLSLLVSRNVARSLGAEPDEIRDISEKVASGDLQLVFDSTSGGAYEAMKEMSANLSSIISEIKSRSMAVGDQASSLSLSARRSSESVSGISMRLEEVDTQISAQSVSMEEVTTAITEISENIVSLNGIIVDQSSQVVESSSAVQEMVSSINSVSSNMQRVAESAQELLTQSSGGYEKITESNEQIKQVAEQSQRLRETNSIVSGIAAQTNLLAMNAAIEAAHAGDAGRGFSVVADEIRKLAESSSVQSQEISAMLASVQSLIDAIVVSSGEALSSFESINEAVKSVSARNTEITNAMTEQSAGSQQVLTALANMTNLTETIKTAASEITIGSARVRDEMIKLKSSSDRSKTLVSEIASSSSEIRGVVESVSSTSETNKEMVDAIVSELTFFKVEAADESQTTDEDKPTIAKDDVHLSALGLGAD